MKREGTFKTCTNCKKRFNCCETFDKMNPPTLTLKEIELIENEYSDFYENLGDNLYRLKVEDNTCIFFRNGKCVIYDIRPLDCRLFPFDIIKDNDKYYLILYKLECINIDCFLNALSEIDSIIEKIIPNIEAFTDKINFTKMQDMKYIIIKEIKV